MGETFLIKKEIKNENEIHGNRPKEKPTTNVKRN